MSLPPNVGCARGHRYWTDRPEAWAGRACLYCYGNELTASGAHRVKVHRCLEPLRILPLEPPRIRGEAVAVDGLAALEPLQPDLPAASSG